MHVSSNTQLSNTLKIQILNKTLLMIKDGNNYVNSYCVP